VPLYFFHLSFGNRTLLDDEGVELPNRSAARKEASAVIRDLAAPEVAGNPRRWAGWFLQVADKGGQFLRLPIGHPALEIVARSQLAECAAASPDAEGYCIAKKPFRPGPPHLVVLPGGGGTPLTR
jgi:hypothetical protein